MRTTNGYENKMTTPAWETKVGVGSHTLSIGGRPMPTRAAAPLAHRPASVIGERTASAALARPLPVARACRPGEVDGTVVAAMEHVAARCAADLGLGHIDVHFFTELDAADRAMWKRGCEDFVPIRHLAGEVPGGFARSAVADAIFVNWDRWSSARRDPWVLAGIVAHELKHLDQFRRRWPGPGGRTADEQAVADQVAEADANAYAQIMVAQLWQEATRG